MRKIFFISTFLILVSVFNLSAQKCQNCLRGTIIDSESKKPLEFVAISILELNQWSTSCKKGNFCFKNMKSGTYTIYASSLGYGEYRKSIKIDSTNKIVRILLDPISLSIKEVVVTAKQNLGLGSSSKIEKAALNHIQAASVKDIMQLLPGQVSMNPGMKNADAISIREIGYNKNSSLGTAIIMNGAPMSNDANLQCGSTCMGATSKGSSVVGGGVDLRQIPTDNIESVEVITGIAGVEYGDLTSGAVIIKTRAGKSPLHVKLKADPNIKSFSLGKGFKLKDNLGSVNVDLDYTSSYDDIRTRYSGFDRLTGTITYSNRFFKRCSPLRTTTKVTMFRTEDANETDPEIGKEEDYSSKDIGYRINTNGRWSLNKPWLTNIKYTFSIDQKNQKNYEKRWISNNGPTSLSTSRESGEFLATYLPSEYLSELTIKGKPINLYGQVSATIAGTYGKVINKILIGAEYRYNINKGVGRIFDENRPPFSNTRTRKFSDIPASKKYALFLEDKFTLPIGKTKLETQAGLRINNFQPDGLFDSEVGFYYEPRVNLKYTIINNDSKILRSLKLRGGYGINVKSPTLMHLYPDPSYMDKISLNYYSENADNRMVVTTTNVIQNNGNHIKASKNIKRELGLDINIEGVNVSLTGYYEKGSNGYEFINIYKAFDYRVYNQIPEGLKPEYHMNNVTVNGEALGYHMEKDMTYYKHVLNTGNITKKGLEFNIDFGQIKTLKTSVVIDGSWMQTSRKSNSNRTERPSQLYDGKKYPFVAIYPHGEKMIKERLSTNLRIISHFPKIGMIISATMQTIWDNKSQSKWDKVYITDDDGNKIYGNRVFNDENSNKYLDPIKFIDMSGNTHDFLPEHAQSPQHAALIKNVKRRSFIQENEPEIFQFNLKLSKEVSDAVDLSFFVNNIFNHRPKILSDISGSYVWKNQPIYFGAEVSFKL